jgi:hypothetical protein
LAKKDTVLCTGSNPSVVFLAYHPCLDVVSAVTSWDLTVPDDGWFAKLAAVGTEMGVSCCVALPARRDVLFDSKQFPEPLLQGSV